MSEHKAFTHVLDFFFIMPLIAYFQLPSPTVLTVLSFIPFNTTIPIATLLVAMPTPLKTSWQPNFFQFSLGVFC